MKLSAKHKATLNAIFHQPISGNIRWKDIEALFIALGANIEEREGSRVGIIFEDQEPAVFHRPHPATVTDKGAVKVIRLWLMKMGISPEGE